MASGRSPAPRAPGRSKLRRRPRRGGARTAPAVQPVAVLDPLPGCIGERLAERGMLDIGDAAALIQWGSSAFSCGLRSGADSIPACWASRQGMFS